MAPEADSRSNGNRTAVYTAIFGGYEALLPQRRIPGVDFVCFADRDVRARPWKTVRVEPHVGDATRDARRYKILPHRFLTEYDISIWIDANYLVVGDVDELIDIALRSSNIGVFDHSQTAVDPRNCTYEEFDEIMRLHNEKNAYKDDPEVMRAQIERYRREGYPPGNGLAFSAAIVRRHHAPDVVRTMERWWKEVSDGSRRDQLSFNYVAWVENLSFTVIDGDLRNNRWFYMIGTHRKSYRWKMFRYWLRRRLGLIRHGAA